MHALIDADTPVISTAIVSEDATEEIARARLRMNISSIIDGCSKIDSFTLYVSGGRNFRKDIDPSYKANRTLPDPKYREMLRQYLIQDWGAIECVGYEADDACGVYQTDKTMIVGIDKDLLQVPGYHYSWPIVRKGVVQREAIWQEVSEEQGWRNLFTQCLTGDVTDNIKGIRGIGHVKAAKILEDCHTEEEMYTRCLMTYLKDVLDETEIYYETERFERNLNLLYIWRSLGITYSIRKEIYDHKRN